ncbi:MAG: 50S ribosomal protein L4 [Gammaproteobacteria bacterium]|nr:50S ribosomal protein L4 [Gammaproteobacteria bacterium]
MQLNIADQKKEITVADAVFACDYNEALLHQVVIAHMAGGRAGTVAQKTRSEVKASGRKPWRQKGLGRARAGTVASPLWRGGGITFAGKPQDYRQKVNRKMYRKALRIILSELIRQQRLVIVNDLTLEQPKTKLFLEAVKAFDFDNGLVLTHEANDNLLLAVRNLPYVDYCTISTIDPVKLIGAKKVLATVETVKRFEEWLA